MSFQWVQIIAEPVSGVPTPLPGPGTAVDSPDSAPNLRLESK